MLYLKAIVAKETEGYTVISDRHTITSSQETKQMRKKILKDDNKKNTRFPPLTTDPDHLYLIRKQALYLKNIEQNTQMLCTLSVWYMCETGKKLYINNIKVLRQCKHYQEQNSPPLKFLMGQMITCSVNTA